MHASSEIVRHGTAGVVRKQRLTWSRDSVFLAALPRSTRRTGDGTFGVALTWRISVESREPVHRLGRCAAVIERHTGSKECRRKAPSLPIRSRVHFRLATGERDASAGARSDRTDRDPNGERQGAERTDVWRAPRSQQGGARQEVRG